MSEIAHVQSCADDAKHTRLNTPPIESLIINATDIAIDINGYFAAPFSGRLSLYNLAPCRVQDTRSLSGIPAFTGTVTETATGRVCGVPPKARSPGLNAAAVPSGALGYISLWANQGSQPVISRC
jgi:hypothetical protein